MADGPEIKTGWMRKRLAGIPVIYLVGGFVLILAVYAWTLKPSASLTASDAADSGDSSTDVTGMADSETYPDMPTGTVVVAPATQSPDTSLINSSIDDNDQWLIKGTQLLVDRGISGGVAQGALQRYLDGSDLTYYQGSLRDAVIKEYGLPPYPPATISRTNPKPARRQGPTPRYHTVTGVSDNTIGELVQLYYGSNNAFLRNAVLADSHNKGLNGSHGAYAKGDRVWIPNRPTPKDSMPKTPTKTTAHPSKKNPAKTVHVPSLGGNLHRGSTGTRVKTVQSMLNRTNHAGLKVDGIYGSKTEAAVKAYQRREHIRADGIVGPVTWTHLYRDAH